MKNENWLFSLFAGLLNSCCNPWLNVSYPLSFFKCFLGHDDTF